MDAKALIQFIGLVTFTTQLLPLDTHSTRVSGTAAAKVASFRERQLVAIMPRVGPPPPTQGTGIKQVARGRANATEVHTGAVARAARVHEGHVATAGGPQLVEDHTAMIAFNVNDLISVNGWVVKQLHDDFRYIELNGEQLSFVTNAANPRVNTSLRLGRVPGSALKPQFRPPAYGGAAAVVSIPNGTMDSCKSTFNGRMDTQLSLDNKGTLTIQASGKSLIVDGNAAVVIANVPLLWATSQVPSGGTTAAHYHVYCAMTGTFPCDFNPMKPPADPTIPNCANNLMKVIPASNPSGPTPRPQVVPGIFAAFDVFCSNTQWP